MNRAATLGVRVCVNSAVTLGVMSFRVKYGDAVIQSHMYGSTVTQSLVW